MIKRSIASNHLSSLASKGRYGDTEMARTSEGELWHVNRQEKDLMGMYGRQGEKMVDALGSGTINPQTGLEEKFPPLVAAAVIGSAVGLYGAATGAKERKTQGKFDVDAGWYGYNQAAEAEKVLDKTIDAQKSAAMKDYSMATEELSGQTGISIEDLEKSTEKIIQRSNMATVSGERRETMWDRIQQTHGLRSDSLTAKFAKNIGDLEGTYEAEKARLRNEKNKFARMVKLGEEKQKGLFG